MASNFGQHYHFNKTTSNDTNKFFLVCMWWIFQNVVWSWNIWRRTVWRGSEKQLEVWIKGCAGTPFVVFISLVTNSGAKWTLQTKYVLRCRSDIHKLCFVCYNIIATSLVEGHNFTSSDEVEDQHESFFSFSQNEKLPQTTFMNTFK